MGLQERLKKIDAIAAGINKKHGYKVIDRAANMMDQLTVDFIPTPSVGYNKALSGGFARGRITEVSGEHASGKTSILLETIALDMKHDPEAIWGWLETENSLEKEAMCDMFGIDPERFYYWHVDDLGAETSLDTLEALIRSNQFKGFVCNSVAGLTPQKELESEMARQAVGEQARLMSKLMRKITAIVSKNKVAMIFTNQLREKVGVMYGDSRTETGGRALPFFATQRIRQSKVKLEAKDGISEDEGMKIRCKVLKNRLAKGNPYVTVDYLVRYGVGIDIYKEVLDLAIDAGIIQKGGAWYYFPNKEECGDNRWNGTNAILDHLRENAEFLEMIKFKVSESIVARTLTDEEIAEIQAEEAALEKEIAEELGETVE